MIVVYGLIVFAVAMLSLSAWMFCKGRPTKNRMGSHMRTLSMHDSGLHYHTPPIIRLKPEEDEKDGWAS